MSKHTPGPWILSLRGRALAGGRYSGHSITDAASCQIAFLQNHPSRSSETDRANALLIAAAPDMLEALETAGEGEGDEWCACPEYGWDPLDNSHTLFCDTARAAIAKAKGES